MVFSSLLFAFYFLPLVIVVYYLAKEKYRNYILLVASLVFYAYGEPRFVFVMIVVIIINYVSALFIGNSQNCYRNKIALIVTLAVDIGVLFIFKYLKFSINQLNRFFQNDISSPDITLPIGISFFTFQAISYVVDVYRGTVKPQKNPFYIALYVSFFPQLIAGPIVRYSTIEDQMVNRRFSVDLFSDGARRFMVGFAKKVILANNLAEVSQNVFACDPTMTNAIYLWLGSVCYSLQIFFDFSGYSDMAIGLAKLFGFKFEENFNYPYLASSVTDFWRRWHISLSSWFRDYVYIPLGGSRVSIPRHVFNLLIVWLLTGIWHGANYTFIGWGLGYFFLLVFEKYVIKPDLRHNILFRTIWRVFTLLCVNFAWVIFNSENLLGGVRFCLGMLGYYGNSFEIHDSAVLFNIHEYGFFMLVALIISTPIFKWLNERLENIEKIKGILIVKPFLLGAVFLWAVSFLIIGAHNPFIYFNF